MDYYIPIYVKKTSNHDKSGEGWNGTVQMEFTFTQKQIIGDGQSSTFDQRRVIIEAGKAGYISNLLAFLGDSRLDLNLELLIVDIAGHRQRNFDLIEIFKNIRIHPLVKKSIEVKLFDNINRASEDGLVSEMLLFIDSKDLPDYMNNHAKMLIPKALDNAIRKGYYQSVPELIGNYCVDVETQLKAFEFWEKGRASDFDIEMVLREKNLHSSLIKAAVDALFRRRAVSKIPQMLRVRKIQDDKRKEDGEIISLRDFKDPKRKEVRMKWSQTDGPIVKLRRRKVC